MEVTGTFHDPNTPHEFQWINPTTKVAEDGTEITTAGHMEAYHNVSKEIRDQLDAKDETVQIIPTRINNDIYSTIDACPNACERWKAIERLKQGESINVQDLETNLYWEFGKFTSRDGESLESYYSRMAKNEVYDIRAERQAHTTNPHALVAQQQPVYHSQNHPTNYTKISSTRSHQAATRNRGKAIINSPKPTYNQELAMVTDNDELSKENEIDKLMALISLVFKKIYKPTNNNLRTSSNISRANQDNTLRIISGTGYDNQRAVNVAGARETVGTKELEAHYLYMAQIQEFTPDVADNSGTIFDAEPLQKVQHDDDNYNVFTNEIEHPEQPESVNGIYLDEHNIIIDSLDMCHDREQDDQDDNDDLAKEHDLLASLIDKLKCEIDDSKNRNKLLESSNKILVDKLNTHFKEANNELHKTNKMMVKDLVKFQDEIKKHSDVKYMSKVELDCAKAKTDLIMSQEKEAQKQFYKTREDKEIEKVIALENKVKFLKKAKRTNPRLYDRGCYNDNLAVMLASESDKTIRLSRESQ
ncbi:hypothetical protein Tco_1069273 [Tanacetum coccineum]|uniref:Uncharacterized protein n=1 Tax=Tanacetum coccineum TaxID=301880 RepID=A0ABQ5HI40_9ASTR